METKKELTEYLNHLDSVDLMSIMGWLQVRIDFLKEGEKLCGDKDEKDK